MKKILTALGAAALALNLGSFAASAATCTVVYSNGQGKNKTTVEFEVTQDIAADPGIAGCAEGNDYGNPNVWAALGYTEVDYFDIGQTGTGVLSLDAVLGTWTITLPTMFENVILAFKQAGAHAGFLLDGTSTLTGEWFVDKDGNSPFDFSHVSVWVRNPVGPPPAVPLPAAGLLLLAGMGALAMVRRRKA